jgi:predicted nucleotidyltransferase component of viral defense system
MFLHELTDARDLFLVVSAEKAINPSIVEKDYWVMHALWGLQQQSYDFELKGGTSLSKGYSIINRFSEDIDIQMIRINISKTVGIFLMISPHH